MVRSSNFQKSAMPPLDCVSHFRQFIYCDIVTKRLQRDKGKEGGSSSTASIWPFGISR